VFFCGFGRKVTALLSNYEAVDVTGCRSRLVTVEFMYSFQAATLK